MADLSKIDLSALITTSGVNATNNGGQTTKPVEDTQEPSYGVANKSDENDYYAEAQFGEDDEIDTNSAEFKADTTQLKEDWDYLNELKAGVEQGDEEAINEVKNLELRPPAQGNDENAVQMNKNSKLLAELKKAVGQEVPDPSQMKKPQEAA